MSFFTNPPRSWPFIQQSNFDGRIPYPVTGNDFNQDFVPRIVSAPGSFTGTITGQILQVTTSSNVETFYVTIGEVTITNLNPSLLYNGYTILNSLFELSPSTSYNATVVAVNRSGTTGCSNDPISFTTADANLPSAFTFTISGQTITSSGSTDARFYRVTANDNTITTDTLNNFVIDNDEFGLVPPQQYLASVVAVNSNGSTPSTSNPVLFTAMNQTGPTGPGFDIFMVIGQSNAVAYGNYAVTSPQSNILQWGTNESPENTVNTYQYLDTPISRGQPSITNDSYYGSEGGGYSWCVPFAQAYAASSLRANRQVLLVNTAIGGTNIERWIYDGAYTIPTDNGGDAYIEHLASRAVQYAANAMAYNASSQTNRICGFLHLGHEYSTGYGSSYLEAGKLRMEYVTGLYTIINYFRNNITGATTTTPFVSGMFRSDWVTSCDALMPLNGGNFVNMLPVNGHANVLDLQTNIHEVIQNFIPYSYYADNTLAMEQSGAGNAGIIHYGAAQLAVYGQAYYNAYLLAITNTSPSTPVSYSSVPAAPTITATNNNTATPGLSWTTVTGAYSYTVTAVLPGKTTTVTVGTPYLLNGTDYPTNYFIQSAGYLQFTSGSGTMTVTANNFYGQSVASNSVSLTYAPTTSFFFDTYPAAVGGFQQGWSLRQLSSSSTKAIRIYIDVDTSQDIGFNSD